MAGVQQAEKAIQWDILATALDIASDDIAKHIHVATEQVIENQSELSEEMGEFIRRIGNFLAENLLKEQANG